MRNLVTLTMTRITTKGISEMYPYGTLTLGMCYSCNTMGAKCHYDCCDLCANTDGATHNPQSFENNTLVLIPTLADADLNGTDSDIRRMFVINNDDGKLEVAFAEQC